MNEAFVWVSKLNHENNEAKHKEKEDQLINEAWARLSLGIGIDIYWFMVHP